MPLGKTVTIGFMETVGQRIKRIREEVKMTRTGLAKKIGMPYSTLADIENDNMKGSTRLAEVAQGLGVSAYYLQTGLGDPQAGDNANVSAALDPRGVVPLVSRVQAGNFREVFDEFQPGDPRMEWITCPIPVRRHTFALRVEGDSMEPDFPNGYVLFVEPDAEAVPGSFVIAKNGDNEATFKQLVKDGADWYLRPLNPRYPIKPLGDSIIIGVVKFSGRFL